MQQLRSDSWKYWSNISGVVQLDGYTESLVHSVNPGLGCHHMRSSHDVGAEDGAGVTILTTGEADGAGDLQIFSYAQVGVPKSALQHNSSET